MTKLNLKLNLLTDSSPYTTTNTKPKCHILKNAFTYRKPEIVVRTEVEYFSVWAPYTNSNTLLASDDSLSLPCSSFLYLIQLALQDYSHCSLWACVSFQKLSMVCTWCWTKKNNDWPTCNDVTFNLGIKSTSAGLFI